MDDIRKQFIKPKKINTNRLLLRAMSVKDAVDMYEYAGLPKVTEYLLWAPHDNLKYTKNYLKSVESSYKKGEFFDWGIELIQTGKLIGTCGIANMDLPNSTAEIGYVINPAFWGKGYASEALKAVISYCFENLNFNRVEAKYLLGNNASRRVMEKCGMRFEGIKRDGLFVKDGYKSVGTCAILQSDYRRIRHI